MFAAETTQIETAATGDEQSHMTKQIAAAEKSHQVPTQEGAVGQAPLRAADSPGVAAPADEPSEMGGVRLRRAEQRVADAIARQVAREQQAVAERVVESTVPTPHALEQARRSRAREVLRQALHDGSNTEVAQLDDQTDAAAFAEYLRRGNTGKMVLKVLVPVHTGVRVVQISDGVDVRLVADLPNTRWNGSFVVSNGGVLTLQQLRFEGHFAHRQGSVASNNGTMVVVGCTFLSSVSLGVGGVLVNREGGVMYIRDSYFQGNRAMFGGAVFNFNGDLFIEGSTFRGNHAETAGGAVALGPHAQLSIVSCDFIQNSVGTDGDTDAQPGAAVIWSLHPVANCANGTSTCWGNELDVDIWALQEG